MLLGNEGVDAIDAGYLFCRLFHYKDDQLVKREKRQQRNSLSCGVS
jgi:hypothetical protein